MANKKEIQGEEEQGCSGQVKGLNIQNIHGPSLKSVTKKKKQRTEMTGMLQKGQFPQAT